MGTRSEKGDEQEKSEQPAPAELDAFIKNVRQAVADLLLDAQDSRDGERANAIQILAEHFAVMHRLRKRRDTQAVLGRYQQECIPKLNEDYANWFHLCMECGDLCPKDLDFCEDACRARNGMRGREKVGKGVSPAETALRRREKKLQAHKAKCEKCKKKVFCSAHLDLQAKMVAAEDIWNRQMVSSLTIEAAEEHSSRLKREAPTSPRFPKYKQRKISSPRKG